jgi:hypothetical protein
MRSTLAIRLASFLFTVLSKVIYKQNQLYIKSFIITVTILNVKEKILKVKSLSIVIVSDNPNQNDLTYSCFYNIHKCMCDLVIKDIIGKQTLKILEPE